jgi:hypothetical protein
VIGLVVERRKRESVVISRDLARHMAERQIKGKIAVVTTRPVSLMSAVRKQWLRLIRLAQRDQSSTLNHQHKIDLAHDILSLQSTTFSAKHPTKDPIANICFATLDQFLLAPPICSTIYITDSVKTQEQFMLTSWMPPGGLVVIYE